MALPTIEVAAFGVQPRQPPSSDIVPAERPGTSITTRVFHHDTWESVLERLELEEIASLRLHALPGLLPAKFIRAQHLPGGQDTDIDYVISAQEAYAIHVQGREIQVRRGVPTEELLTSMRNDASKDSLFAATDAVGLPEAVTMQIASIFADEVDFLQELGQGYRCAVVFEMYYPEGNPTPGLVHAAEFVSPTRHLRAYFFDDGTDVAGYFDRRGVDINKTLRPAEGSRAVAPEASQIDPATTFRRLPLEFSRVTSLPSARRFHPLLKVWREHRGTDYAAPTGTRVMATADGQVSFVGKRGVLGNAVVLRHFDRYTTVYGHLSAFAKGLRAGQTVQKGEVIGRVGSTGLSTGPHLHYEFHVDPTPHVVSKVVPPVPMVVRRLSGPARDRFEDLRTRYDQQLDFARHHHLVLLE